MLHMKWSCEVSIQSAGLVLLCIFYKTGFEDPKTPSFSRSLGTSPQNAASAPIGINGGWQKVHVSSTKDKVDKQGRNSVGKEEFRATMTPT